MTRRPRIPLIGRTADLFYTTLPYIGVRSWDAYAQFEVRNGELYTSKTGVGDIRMERLDSSKYRHEVFLGYEVQTWHESVDPVPRCAKQNYLVRISHGSVHVPADALETCVLQSAGIPVKRAFDVRLRCLNSLFRSCRFDELAPSAWADYSANDGHRHSGPARVNLSRLVRTG
jgi:hypothetical protein